MKTVFKPRYKFKFLINVSWDGELKFTKLAPILNQLGIEGVNDLEEIMATFFGNLTVNQDNPINFFASIFLIIWRRESPYSFFSIIPFTLDSLIKFWLDINKDEHKKRTRVKLALKFSHLSSLYWDTELGYGGGILKNKLTTIYALRGTLPTYSKRDVMLGRKVNFKRKTKGKTLDQY